MTTVQILVAIAAGVLWGMLVGVICAWRVIERPKPRRDPGGESWDDVMPVPTGTATDLMASMAGDRKHDER